MDKDGFLIIIFFNLALKVSATKYIAKPLSTFHQINAYEEDGLLILDMCASDDGQAITNYNIQNLRKSGEALDEVRGNKLWDTFSGLMCDIFPWVQLMFLSHQAGELIIFKIIKSSIKSDCTWN